MQESHQEELFLLNDSLTQMSTNLNVSRQEIVVLLAERRILNDRLSALSTTLNDLQKEKDALDTKALALVKSLSASVQENSALNNKTLQLLETLKSLENATEQQSNLNKKIESLQQQVSELARQRNSLSASLEAQNKVEPSGNLQGMAIVGVVSVAVTVIVVGLGAFLKRRFRQSSKAKFQPLEKDSKASTEMQEV